VHTDPKIIDKYYALKSALLAKINHDPSAQQLTHSRKLLSTYKYVTASLIELIAEFETQIESSMERSHYNRKVIGVVKEWELRLEDAKSAMEGLGPKIKLIAKEETSALGYYCSELDGKLENLGLLIEVHKKMHQIIEQAAKS
jgi:hypothetical protein